MDRKYEVVSRWMGELRGRGQQVLVLTCFPATFLELQSALNQRQVEYDILAERVSEDGLLARVREADDSPLLTMSQMLQPAGPVSSGPPASGRPLALIVVERHPLPRYHEALQQFARNLNHPIAIGYILSFDDPVVRFYLGDNFIELLKQLGMGNNDLVSSTMTRRALDRAIKRRAGQISGAKAAESAEEWLALNFSPDS